MRTDESPSDSSDVRLLKRAVEGDELAFQDLFDRYRAHLEQFINLRMDGRLRQRIDTLDVLQETQIAAHRRLEDYLERRPMPLLIWLRKMAFEQMLNLHKMHVRSQRRSVRREAAVPDGSSMHLASRLVDGGISPSKQIIKKERQLIVATAINRLAESDREILLMRFMEGLSYAEIGYSLEITETAARKRSGRSLQKLRERVKETGLGDTT